ncbi:hypothetical protein, partial [Collimonas sp.]|uniref:hypothetical protein n=1 Tax=Collimonas sp. TaxID=1963772 RepID=UPI0037C08252
SSLNSAVYICFGIFFIAGLSKGSLILRYLWKTKFRGKLKAQHQATVDNQINGQVHEKSNLTVHLTLCIQVAGSGIVHGILRGMEWLNCGSASGCREVKCDETRIA